MLIIYTDGCCLGNPGKMGVGIVITMGGKVVKKISRFIGNGTNNIAEYSAVEIALEETKKENNILIRSDSELLIKQMKGEYKVKMPHLKLLKGKIDNLIKGRKVMFEHIPREQNVNADELSKKGAESGN